MNKPVTSADMSTPKVTTGPLRASRKIHSVPEATVPKKPKQDQRKRDLDVQLDKELEGTFPASDPLKITRGRPGKRITPQTNPDDQD